MSVLLRSARETVDFEIFNFCAISSMVAWCLVVLVSAVAGAAS
jgi:hypothetical protein